MLAFTGSWLSLKCSSRVVLFFSLVASWLRNLGASLLMYIWAYPHLSSQFTKSLKQYLNLAELHRSSKYNEVQQFYFHERLLHSTLTSCCLLFLITKYPLANSFFTVPEKRRMPCFFKLISCIFCIYTITTRDSSSPTIKEPASNKYISLNYVGTFIHISCLLSPLVLPCASLWDNWHLVNLFWNDTVHKAWTWTIPYPCKLHEAVHNSGTLSTRAIEILKCFGALKGFCFL